MVIASLRQWPFLTFHILSGKTAIACGIVSLIWKVNCGRFLSDSWLNSGGELRFSICQKHQNPAIWLVFERAFGPCPYSGKVVAKPPLSRCGYAENTFSFS